MRPRTRIVLPLLAATGVVAGILGVIGWQLSLSAQDVTRSLRSTLAGQELLPFAAPQSVDSSDRVLLHLRQGDLKALRGDWAKAQEEYEASVRLGGGIPALRKLAQAQLQRRDLDGVRATIERLEDEGVRDEDLLLLRAIFLLRTGELVDATTLLEAAAASPQRAYGLALLAIIRGDHESAKTHLQEVLTGDEITLRSYARILESAYDEFGQFPNSPALHLTTLLSRALAQVQECELALPLIADVVRAQDDYRDAWMVQGYCELTTERYPQALASFGRAYALDPQKPEIQYFLGRAYAQSKQFEDAQTYLGYALQNGFEPRREVHERLAEVALEAGNPTAALEQYRLILSDPQAEIADLETYVTLAIGTGQRDEALTAAHAGAGQWPENAKAFELLGWAAAENDHPDEARAALEKALLLDPTLTSARERLEKL